MNKDNTNKSSFLDTLSNWAQNFLAHVNISYNGATQSLHIDIVPTEYLQDVSEQKVIEDKSKQMLLEKKDKSGSGKVPENDCERSRRKKVDNYVERQLV